MLALPLVGFAQQTASAASSAPQAGASASAAQPPQMALPVMLRKLHTTARILHITAHPDDEDGPMLALEAWGKGATVMLLTLNRGEGGQNITGSELFDRLGILRTLELLEADRYYGVQQRFTRAADFGFSKSAQESLEKWGDAPLEDTVRVIREFQPDVIVSRFQGAPRDGHGHHQAAGIIAREAFRAAADPKRFPEQLKEGLQSWQAKKLYVDNVHEDEDWTLKLETSAVDPLLGESYFQVARAGLRHQLSQGAGNWPIPGGEHYSYYKLVDTVMPDYHPLHEQDFMDGIDVTLADALPASAKAAPEVRDAAAQIAQARAASATSGSVALPALSAALADLDKIVTEGGGSTLLRLPEKREQLQQAINLAAGAQLDASVTSAAGLSQPQPLIRDESFKLQVSLRNNGSEPLRLESITLHWRGQAAVKKNYKDVGIEANAVSTQVLGSVVPSDAPLSKPYFHRVDEDDALNQIDELEFATLPFAAPPLTVSATYHVGRVTNTINTTAEMVFTRDGATARMPLPVAPDFSVRLAPATQILPVGERAPRAAEVMVGSNVNGKAQGTARLALPADWSAQPASREISFGGEASDDAEFHILPQSTAQITTQATARFESDGKSFSEGYELIGRSDIGYAYYYEPAVQKISVVDVKTVPGLKVGYIMGAGDDIPEALRQAGVDAQLISPDELTRGDLSRYGTIIVGIRGYDTRAEVRNNNARLLDFVSRGGTLMVQYNSDVGDFNAGKFTPYPATLSRDRVTVEESPVTLLKPEAAIFHFPNEIAPRDFSGWVQERGLYFMSSWDPRFEPLIACHDPGEPPMAGGLLVARYGKGLYIYNAYAFFRQLPTGVPGALRLYVNLLSAGHEPKGTAAAAKAISTAAIASAAKSADPKSEQERRAHAVSSVAISSK